MCQLKKIQDDETYDLFLNNNRRYKACRSGELDVRALFKLKNLKEILSAYYINREKDRM
jgi:hypothetical protein